MNTQVQKIKDEIERRIRETDLKDVDEYRSLLTFINSLPEEPINDNLDNSVEKQIDKITEERQTCNGGMRSCRWYFDDWFKEGAKFGANWQKKQMIKDATYATCCGLHAFQALWCFDNLKTSDVVAGDRVKVIIVKEDEQC